MTIQERICQNKNDKLCSLAFTLSGWNVDEPLSTEATD